VRMFIDPLGFLILICINDPTLLTHSEIVEVLLFTFCPLSGTFLDGIHKTFKVLNQFYGFTITIVRPFREHISQRGIVNNVKVTSYNVESRIIYEWEIFTGQLNISTVTLKHLGHFVLPNFYRRVHGWFSFKTVFDSPAFHHRC
jgi:hypothetical protein